MNNPRCPITYEAIDKNQKYSAKGLRLLSPKLINLHDFPYNIIEQRQEARKLATKMSIQGVQPKLSAKLNIKDSCFEIVENGGTFILKPQNELYPELPENEDLTMRLAKVVDIEVPLHGLIYCKDDSFTYFIKRFDRKGIKQKIPLEDFAQLSGSSRETKYNASMEKLILIIDKFCTFPVLEKRKLFVRTIFHYIVGNEDMHLKNFSLTTHESKVELSPAYDFLNSTLALANATEEVALPLNGKKRNLKRSDFVDYYGQERLGLNTLMIEETLIKFKNAIPNWEKLIHISFLSDNAKEEYLKIVKHRSKILEIL